MIRQSSRMICDYNTNHDFSLHDFVHLKTTLDIAIASVQIRNATQ